jgi:hypothetical protein
VVVVLLVAGRPGRTAPSKAAVAFAAAAVLAAPALASASVVENALGPFDTPFEPLPAWELARTLGGLAKRTEALLPPLEQARNGQPDLMATQTSAVAAPFIYDAGQEVLPIGGYTGTIPEPTLETLRSMIARKDFRLVIQAPVVSDPRLIWVAKHCFALPPVASSPTGPGALRFAVYYCGRTPVL